MNKVLVVGDTLKEVDKKQVTLGGAGNVARHLAQWFDKVYYLMPHNQHRTLQPYSKPDNTEIVSINSFTSLIAQREWHGTSTIGLNPHRVSMDSDTSIISYDTKTLINLQGVDTIYFEWHFPHNVSFAAYMLHRFPFILNNRDVFFDCRQPQEIGPFLAPLIKRARNFYWKMNDAEYARFQDSEREYYQETEFTLVQTHGSYGLVCAEWKDGQPDKSTAIWMGGYDIPHAPDAHTSGCGDSFFSTFCATRQESKSLGESLTMATIAGGIAASRPRTCLVTKNEVLNVYESERSLSGTRWKRITATSSD